MTLSRSTLGSDKMYRLKRATFIGLAGLLLLLLLLTARPAEAQLAGVKNYWNPATGNWSVASNWSLGTLPNGQTTDDFAVIGGVSGASGISVATATINSAIADMPGGISLGATVLDKGTLQISSGGSITVADTAFDGDGNVYVGVAGTGTLNVDRGGSLTAVGIISGGISSSSVRLGGTSGSGSATVVVGDANFNQNTRVIGPNVNFTASNVTFGSGGTLTEQIISSTHSALKANDNAILGGALAFEFDPGLTPTVGTTWDLFNARQVAGAFDTVDLSKAPPLALGQIYNLRTQSGGLGRLVQLAVEERLVLNVNRTTHAVSISNPGTTPIAIDGYAVHSTVLSGLNPANFIPLGGTWQVANALPTSVNQLNPTAAPTFGIGSTTSIGNIFAPPTPAGFGNATEDLTFEYTQSSDGSIRTGVVNYIGTTGVNNLVLRVDPANGAAQLVNTSSFSVNVDGYTIASNLNSLETAQWSSLDDQNVAGGDWQEADISTGRLSEIKFAGFTTLVPGQSFSLGNPFNETLGKKDLVFQFLLQGQTTPNTGVVVYETISAALPGDYNGNGVVDAGDYVLWRKTPASYGGAGGYTTWRNNFGAPPGSGSGTLNVHAVPEPSSSALFFIALGLMFATVLQRRSIRLGHAPCIAVRN